MSRRILLLTAAVLVVAGCAGGPPDASEYAKLQDALPQRAILYLLRDPYDEIKVLIQPTSKPSIELADKSYTVISIDPGTYTFRTTGIGKNGNVYKIADDFSFEARANQRLVLIFSGSVQTRNDFRLNPYAQQLETVPGSRKWTLASDLEAESMVPQLELVQNDGKW